MNAMDANLMTTDNTMMMNDVNAVDTNATTTDNTTTNTL